MKTIWPLILISYFSLVVFGVTDNIRGPLFPEILKSFNLSDSLGSFMFALSSISGFLSSHFARFLLQRFDRLNILRWASLSMVIAMNGLALSPYFSIFLFFSFIFGISSGLIGLIPNILVPLGSSAERKQQFLSGLHSMYGVASLFAPIAVAVIGGTTGNWRYVFSAVSLVPFALFIYSFHASHLPHHLKPTKKSLDQKTIKKRNFKPQVFLALMVSFAVAAEIMLSSRLALYTRRYLGSSLEDSSFYVSMFFISMLVGRLIFTGFKFRKSPRFLLNCSALSTLFCIIIGLNFYPIFLAFAGFGIAPYYPLAITFISEEFPEDLDTAISYMIACDSLMLVFMHLFIGRVSDLFGIHIALYSGVAFLLITFFLNNTYSYFFKKN